MSRSFYLNMSEPNKKKTKKRNAFDSFTKLKSKSFIIIFKYTLFYRHSVIFGQAQYAYGFSILNVILYLQYASNNRICCHGYLITTSQGPTGINHSPK